jgi:hypothetical protein
LPLLFPIQLNIIDYFCQVKIYVNDSIQMLKKASFRRLRNALKVYGSYYRSKWTGKPNQKGLPMAIAIEPTTACNLGCPE